MANLFERRHFEAIATMLGDIARDMDREDFERMMLVANRHLTGTNPQYSRDRVFDWATEVRLGVRDIDGRKVAGGDRERTGV